MREFEQAIDGFQVLNAATKWIHDHTKTQPKNKLKVANGNELLSLPMFRLCHALHGSCECGGELSDNSSPLRTMSEIVNRA